MMSTLTTTLRVDSHGMALHLGMPEHSARRVPALVVIQHAPGVDAFIHAMVQRLNDAGYIAAAPDLYHRQPQDGADGLERMKRLIDSEVVTDIDATTDYLRSHPAVDPERIGIIGFCMGGRIAYLMAAADQTLKASVVYYGGNIMVPWGPNEPSPFARTKEINCPILFHFGAEDTNPSPDDMKKLNAELTRLGKTHEFHVYANAGHAFMNFLNVQRYREAATQESWPRTLAFLSRCLGR